MLRARSKGQPARRRTQAVLGGLGLLMLGSVHAADAHSIGGDGVATVARLEVDVGGIAGQYEIQYGEVAALRLRQAMDGNGDERLDYDEQQPFLDSLAARYATGLRLTLDGAPVPVRLGLGQLLPRGEWGVAPVPSSVVFELRAEGAALTVERTRLAFVDSNALAGALHRTWVVTSYDLVDLEAPVAGVVGTPSTEAPLDGVPETAGRVAAPKRGSAVKGVQFQGPPAGVRGAIDLHLSQEARAGLHGDAAAAPGASPWSVPLSAGPFTAAVFGAIVGFGLACALLERRRRRPDGGGASGGSDR